MQFCRQFYGSTIESIPARGDQDPSFRLCLSKIKSETGSEIGKELLPENLERVENFFLNSRLLNCLPPLTTSANTAEIDHVVCLHELAQFKEAEANVGLSQIHGRIYQVV